MQDIRAKIEENRKKLHQLLRQLLGLGSRISTMMPWILRLMLIIDLFQFTRLLTATVEPRACF